MHERTALDASAAAARALPWALPRRGEDDLGVPLLGPWWDRASRSLGVPDDHVPVMDLPFGPTAVERVRRRRGLAPRKELVPAGLAFESAARWHRARAKGQRDRALTVGHCGDGQVTVSCGSCGGAASVHPIRCGTVRLCVACMTRRSMKVRARFARARGAIYADAFRRNLVGPRAKLRRGGAWSERHLVLTVPHETVLGPGGAVDRAATARQRIERLFSAWAHFARSLQRYYRAHQHEGTRLYRCFEWTMGADGLGHPHLHVWILGPYLPERDFHRVEGMAPSASKRCASRGMVPCAYCAAGVPVRRGVRSWWQAACEKAGLRRASGVPYTGDELNLTLRSVFVRLLEFVREVRKPNGLTFQRRELRIQTEDEAGMMAYFEPWTIASVDTATGERASADVLAAVYCALEGKRLSQGSRGFLGIGDALLQAEGAARLEGCPCCGEVGAPRRVDVEDWRRREWGDVAPRADVARGPPGPAGPPAAAAPVCPVEFAAILAEAAAELRTLRRPRNPDR